MGWIKKMAVLTDMQKRFADYILNGETATQAAKLAGYKDSQSLRKSASNLLHRPHVQAYLQARETYHQVADLLPSMDAAAMSHGASLPWVEKRLVALVADDQTKATDRVSALRLIAQLNGWLKESGSPFAVTPIILTSSGREIATLTGEVEKDNSLMFPLRGN